MPDIKYYNTHYSTSIFTFLCQLPYLHFIIIKSLSIYTLSLLSHCFTIYTTCIRRTICLNPNATTNTVPLIQQSHYLSNSILYTKHCPTNWIRWRVQCKLGHRIRCTPNNSSHNIISPLLLNRV